MSISQFIKDVIGSSIFFDNTTSGLTSENVEDAINEVSGGGGTGVVLSPAFGNNGNLAANSYLPNQSVPSNIVGYPISATSPKLRTIFFGNENTVTGNLLIQERFPAITGTWTTVYTLTLSSQTNKNVTGLSVSLNQGSELSIKTEVAIKNAKVVLSVTGNSV